MQSSFPSSVPTMYRSYYLYNDTTTPNSFPTLDSTVYDATNYDSVHPENASSNDYYNCIASDGNMTYLNVSCETILNYSIPLYGYCTPVLLLVTLTANSLIVIVLSKRSMVSPTNCVLMAMALCDMFTLLFPAPGLMYMYTFGNHYKPLSLTTTCYVWNALNEIILTCDDRVERKPDERMPRRNS
ncbi:sex peptide receptor [Anopheles sinensis]|uniref:Sex peptide receptor n=1 Tax=Anopheles sinensis TaxID=74873 RepID=A0A084WCB8_ANOSI|nr:sex peptide receptor [Anopheles sinensis]